jgi:hypothetical protein
MSQKHKWDHIRKRSWETLRDAWMAYIPDFLAPGAAPDPGLEHLTPLRETKIPDVSDLPVRVPDVDGIRRNALWEAVFLFHKCAHANLAAQRLGQQGMQSWCMFNAYHSAYLGAKGIMELLGVALPNLAGKQVAIDLFPPPEKPRKKIAGVLQASSQFNDFLVIRLNRIDQSELWEAFQRLLRVTTADCMDKNLLKELVSIPYDRFSPPRNHFLYQAHFWPPLDDLMSDAALEGMSDLCGAELDIMDKGFLMRLSFSVYHLFEQLMSDLGRLSGVINNQIMESRFLADSELPEIGCYKTFLSQISAHRGQSLPEGAP